MTGRDNRLWIALEAAGIRQVLARSEAAAVYMADGYARLRGTPTFVYGPYGPGAANVAGGLAEPFWAGSPVVALVSAMRRADRYRSEYQELDQPPLFASVTKWGVEASVATPRPAAGPRGRAACDHRRTGSGLPGHPERPLRGGAARTTTGRRRSTSAFATPFAPPGPDRRRRREPSSGPLPRRQPADHPRRQRHPPVRGARRPTPGRRAPAASRSRRATRARAASPRRTSSPSAASGATRATTPTPRCATRT